jgi:dUTP pyrophosphatase
MEPTLSDRFKAVAQIVEKFVENNIVEKDQRDENFRKFAMAFETLIKENPLRKGFSSFDRAGAEKTALVDVQVKKLENFKGELPRYQSDLASGLDVRAQLAEAVTLKPGQRTLIPTGLSFAIPRGFEIQARPRSGWAIRDGVTLLNTPGTIDADYRGEVKIIVVNLGEVDVVIKDQDRIAQLVLCPVLQAQFQVVDELSETERGEGGFGSTGRG